MSSKRRIRAKQCSGKLRHVSSAAALAHARSLWRKDHASMTVYKCKFCKGYHVGHETSKTRAARRARMEGE